MLPSPNKKTTNGGVSSNANSSPSHAIDHLRSADQGQGQGGQHGRHGSPRGAWQGFQLAMGVPLQ